MAVADDADTYVRLRQVDGPPPRGTRLLAPSLTRPWHLRNDNTAVKAGSRRGAARGRRAQGVTDGMPHAHTHVDTHRIGVVPDPAACSLREAFLSCGEVDLFGWRQSDRFGDDDGGGAGVGGPWCLGRHRCDDATMSGSDRGAGRAGRQALRGQRRDVNSVPSARRWHTESVLEDLEALSP